MRERRETLSFLSFLPRRERPLLAGKYQWREEGKMSALSVLTRQPEVGFMHTPAVILNKRLGKASL